MARNAPTPKAVTTVNPQGGDWCPIAKILETNTINLSPREIAALQSKNLAPIIKAEEYGQTNCVGW